MTASKGNAAHTVTVALGGWAAGCVTMTFLCCGLRLTSTPEPDPFYLSAIVKIGEQAAEIDRDVVLNDTVLVCAFEEFFYDRGNTDYKFADIMVVTPEDELGYPEPVRWCGGTTYMVNLSTARIEGR